MDSRGVCDRCPATCSSLSVVSMNSSKRHRHVLSRRTFLTVCAIVACVSVGLCEAAESTTDEDATSYTEASEVDEVLNLDVMAPHNRRSEITSTYMKSPTSFMRSEMPAVMLLMFTLGAATLGSYNHFFGARKQLSESEWGPEVFNGRGAIASAASFQYNNTTTSLSLNDKAASGFILKALVDNTAVDSGISVLMNTEVKLSNIVSSKNRNATATEGNFKFLSTLRSEHSNIVRYLVASVPKDGSKEVSKNSILEFRRMGGKSVDECKAKCLELDDNLKTVSEKLWKSTGARTYESLLEATNLRVPSAFCRLAGVDLPILHNNAQSNIGIHNGTVDVFIGTEIAMYDVETLELNDVPHHMPGPQAYLALSSMKSVTALLKIGYFPPQDIARNTHIKVAGGALLGDLEYVTALPDGTKVVIKGENQKALTDAIKDFALQQTIVSKTLVDKLVETTPAVPLGDINMVGAIGSFVTVG